jgi:hypothetical protein
MRYQFSPVFLRLIKKYDPPRRKHVLDTVHKFIADTDNNIKPEGLGVMLLRLKPEASSITQPTATSLRIHTPTKVGVFHVACIKEIKR